MQSWLRQCLSHRPWWMNALMVFCAYMTAIYMPWDFFIKPVDRDAEVWFGFLLRGWGAKATEPIHWAIYAAGAYGFWRMRPWMSPWAALYTAQVALGMFIWGVVYKGGVAGWFAGLAAAVPLGLIAGGLWSNRQRFTAKRPTLRQRYGEWALITGASAGIGAEFARALARDGMSCVLTARREDRLRALAQELQEQFGVATRVVVADLERPGEAEHVVEAVGDLDLGVFINNAGFGYAGRFDKQDTARLRAMIEVNCVAPVVLASHLVPRLRQRGRGAMIISGSIAGRQPLPYHAIYSASKVFDLHFGEALWAELRGTGVDVLVLEPGPTESEFRDVAGEIREVGEPSANVVAVALEALGRQPSVISGWFNWARATFARLVPRTVLTLMAEDFVLKQTPPEMR